MRFDEKSYYLNKDSKKGVYIIHGFTNTSYEVRDLAFFLSKNGYYAVAENLPGHGTSVEDCNQVKYQDWIDFTMRGITEMAAQRSQVAVIGISMGAVLALNIALHFPIRCLISSAIVLQFKKHFETNYLVPLLNRWIPKVEKGTQFTKEKKKTVKLYGYSHYPMIALNQMRLMINQIRPQLHKIDCPTLMIHSKNDWTSIDKNIDIINNSIKSEDKKLLLVEKAHHCLFDKNPDQQYIFKNVLNYLNKYFN